MEKTQAQRTVDVDTHRPQVAKLSFDVAVRVTSGASGKDPVEPGLPREFAAQSDAIPDVAVVLSVLDEPAAKVLEDAIDPDQLAGSPPKKVSKEDVRRLATVFGAERALHDQPVVVVEILLFRVVKTHEQPVLDFLALGERPARGVQALEDLLWIFVFVQVDSHDSEPLQALNQLTYVTPGDDPPHDLPGLGDRAGSCWLAFEAEPVLVFVAFLEPQLPVLRRRLSRVRQAVVADDLRCPLAIGALGAELLCDTSQEDADGGEPLLAINNADRPYDARRTWFREGQQRSGVVCRWATARATARRSSMSRSMSDFPQR